MKNLVLAFFVMTSLTAHADIVDSDPITYLPEGTVIQFSHLYVDIKPESSENVSVLTTTDGWTCSVHLQQKSADDRILRDFKFTLGDVPSQYTQICQPVQWSEKCQPIPPTVELDLVMMANLIRRSILFSATTKAKVLGKRRPNLMSDGSEIQFKLLEGLYRFRHHDH